MNEDMLLGQRFDDENEDAINNKGKIVIKSSLTINLGCPTSTYVLVMFSANVISITLAVLICNKDKLVLAISLYFWMP